MKFLSFLVLLILVFVASSSCDQGQKASRTKNKPLKKKMVTVPAFNADSAYYFVEKQVLFGPRVPGTKAHKKCLKWLTGKLQQYSDTVIDQHFKARTYDKMIRNGSNIIASFNPEKKKRILLMSHWDSRPFADHDPDPSKRRTPVDAANDGASGVGVLLEMARQFHLKNPDVGVDIVLFDLEDWGPPADLKMYNEEYWGLGSQYWAKNPHVYGYSARFGILLDMVGASDPVFRKEAYSREYARYYLDKVWGVAQDLGYGDNFVNDDGPAISDDHVFVNEYLKIPSIDIIDLRPESSNGTFFEYWHTTGDNMSVIDKESLKITGTVLLWVVYNE
ncbi:MAG: M28 family peptidase [Chlorobi bacterium]|nr:M28 family peptidase [Chlorobiota bacterium]